MHGDNSRGVPNGNCFNFLETVVSAHICLAFPKCAEMLWNAELFSGEAWVRLVYKGMRGERLV